ncbi:hypothetical protein CKO31_04405 [Thiohalocapsa halophila]|uniref:Secreted protein n=1 Tax=Thiohalocapsa halophila TaxID=69359 RepID=A0ABS1CF29_9GAMM|nr:hypothetical protein [Thiohalocapsa halophila]MBK1629996.1 hypothetical protein [Thiohalocapsa halophila]
MITLQNVPRPLLSTWAAIVATGMLTMPAQAAQTPDEYRAAAQLLEDRSQLPNIGLIASDDPDSVEQALSFLEVDVGFPAPDDVTPPASDPATADDLWGVERTVLIAWTTRATALKRACSIVNDAAPTGSLGFAALATRVNAMQNALRETAPYTMPGDEWGSLTWNLAGIANADTAVIFDGLAPAWTTQQILDAGGVLGIYALTYIVDDIWQNARLAVETVVGEDAEDFCAPD